MSLHDRLAALISAIAADIKALQTQGPSTGAAIYAEPVVVAGYNGDVIHHTGEPGVPLFVTTTDGDIVSAGV